MQKSLALLLYDGAGREVFRSREIGRTDPRVEHPIGDLLPGWTVVATPSKENAFTTIQRFIAGEYVLVIGLLVLSMIALGMALRLAVQQVEVAELKSSFLANVTHELKTPLAMIRMASETLELGRVRNEEDSKRFLAVIGRECRRLTHMINNVLDFAKIEEGKREFFFAPGDLKRVVADALEIFEPQFKQGGFVVTVDVPEALPPVEMDSQAIAQCVINLVDNAVKYAGDTKAIAVRVSADGDGRARVAVTDRGIGVAPRDAERIFEKFTRAETGLVHNVKGSGLGLALVRHIARAHGGDVVLQASREREARLRSSFRSSSRSAAVALAPRASRRRRRMAAKILIVEDEPGLLEGSSTTSSSRATRWSPRRTVATASSPRSRRARPRRSRPMLPEKSGFDVLKEFRERNAATPVLILTARNFEADLVQGFDLGADDYLTKPFSVAELMARVRALLKRAPAVDEEGQQTPGTITFGDVVMDLTTAR